MAGSSCNVVHHARKHGTMSASDNNTVRGRKCPQRGRKFEDVVESSIAKTTVGCVDRHAHVEL